MGCFPSRATVQLKNGQRITMEKLNVGDEVKTLDSNGGTKYSEVIAFLHRVPTEPSLFLRFDLQGGRQVMLTSEHLIYTVDRDGLSRSAVFARHVAVGDKLVTSGDMVTSVLNIAIVEGVGLYAPLTTEGTLLVDGALASCYAHVRSHELAHVVMAPVRLMKSVFSFVAKILDILPSVRSASSQHAANVVLSFYTEALLAFTNFLPFKENILSVPNGDLTT